MYIDIHSHVIWGVDDGAEQKAETFRMLKEAAEDGIGKIVCTPHVTPGVYEFPEEAFLAHFREAEAFVRREGLDLPDGILTIQEFTEAICRLNAGM